MYKSQKRISVGLLILSIALCVFLVCNEFMSWQEAEAIPAQEQQAASKPIKKVKPVLKLTRNQAIGLAIVYANLKKYDQNWLDVYNQTVNKNLSVQQVSQYSLSETTLYQTSKQNLYVLCNEVVLGMPQKKIVDGEFILGNQNTTIEKVKVKKAYNFVKKHHHLKEAMNIGNGMTI